MLRYYQHFGLQRDPFLDTSDPQFYLEIPTVRRNMRRVLAAIDESRGLTVVIGPPGSGKSSLCAIVEQVLLSDVNIIIGKISDPTFSSDVEILLAIGRAFGVALKSHSSAELKNALKNFLFDAVVVEKRTLVLLVDEAQNLSTEGLETLRLLLNFQIPEKKLLNLVLFGQDELTQRIAEVENFGDSIDTYVSLEALEPASGAAIIEHRLIRAGKMPMIAVFSAAALDQTIAAGDGLPRRLLNVARSAMTEAADRGSDTVLPDHVTAALRSRGMLPATPKIAPAPVAAAPPPRVPTPAAVRVAPAAPPPVAPPVPTSVTTPAPAPVAAPAAVSATQRSTRAPVETVSGDFDRHTLVEPDVEAYESSPTFFQRLRSWLI